MNDEPYMPGGAVSLALVVLAGLLLTGLSAAQAILLPNLGNLDSGAYMILSANEMPIIAISYCLGCCTICYYLVRWRLGQDVRDLGSGNVGARNVGRLVGWWGLVLTLTADVAKGVAAVWLAAALDISPLGQAGVMVAVVLGHVFPVQLGFRGGKGAATALGALVAAQPWAALALALTFGIALGAFRRFTLAGLAAFASLPPVAAWAGSSPTLVTAIVVVVVLLLATHRRNLRDDLGRLRAATATSGRHTAERG
jgi:glycerol-3-phosphate acyltransferase PlsY